MKRLKTYDLFRQKGAVKTLMETSKNDRNVPVSYMTNCRKNVVDFDRAKTLYCNSLGMSEEYASSADALCETDGDMYLLIEFKDGDFDNPEIGKKARDSAYVLSGIMHEDVNAIRENVIFILVYNQNKKKIGSKQKRALALSNKGQNDFTMFGLAGMRLS